MRRTLKTILPLFVFSTPLVFSCTPAHTPLRQPPDFSSPLAPGQCRVHSAEDNGNELVLDSVPCNQLDNAKLMSEAGLSASRQSQRATEAATPNSTVSLPYTGENGYLYIAPENSQYSRFPQVLGHVALFSFTPDIDTLNSGDESAPITYVSIDTFTIDHSLHATFPVRLLRDRNGHVNAWVLQATLEKGIGKEIGLKKGDVILGVNGPRLPSIPSQGPENPELQMRFSYLVSVHAPSTIFLQRQDKLMRIRVSAKEYPTSTQ